MEQLFNDIARSLHLDPLYLCAIILDLWAVHDFLKYRHSWNTLRGVTKANITIRALGGLLITIMSMTVMLGIMH